MIPARRNQFNQSLFSEARYQELIHTLNADLGMTIQFRLCETPIFLPKDLLASMVDGAHELLRQLLRPEYLKASLRAIPEQFRAPNDQERFHFAQVDFAIAQGPNGSLTPKLVELQAWPSLYGFQVYLPQVYQRMYPEFRDLPYLNGGLDQAQYDDLLRRTVCGKFQPGEVVLMEIDPEQQKTRPDFIVTERMIGVPTVNIRDIKKHGRTLTYQRDGKSVEIRRIYNRTIVEELVQKQVSFGFDLRDELDVEWAGHPNWFFRVSKFSLPFLEHPTVPKAHFVGDLDRYPDDLSNYVLKPLFSFAGSGVKVNITRQDLDAIPEADRQNYLLQEKISYAPAVPTMDEPSKLEVRVMFLWPDDADTIQVVTTLPRLSKGALLGVDFNKNRTWVGSSCCFYER